MGTIGKFFKLKPVKSLIYGLIIGHIDHGKTTLTAAITKHLHEKGKKNFWFSINDAFLKFQTNLTYYLLR